jgi:hypothetical protein
VRRGDTLLRTFGWLSIAVSVAWLISAMLWMRPMFGLFDIGAGTPRERRVRFNAALKQHAAVARPYRLWLGCCWGSIMVGLLLRMAMPTSTSDVVSEFESINRRHLQHRVRRNRRRDRALGLAGKKRNRAVRRRPINGDQVAAIPVVPDVLAHKSSMLLSPVRSCGTPATERHLTKHVTTERTTAVASAAGGKLPRRRSVPISQHHERRIASATAGYATSVDTVPFTSRPR